jgi:hypothetical protein
MKTHAFFEESKYWVYPNFGAGGHGMGLILNLNDSGN